MPVAEVEQDTWHIITNKTGRAYGFIITCLHFVERQMHLPMCLAWCVQDPYRDGTRFPKDISNKDFKNNPRTILTLGQNVAQLAV